MLYKEWRQLRWKMLLLAGVYFLIGLEAYKTVRTANDPLFMLQRWFNVSLFVTTLAAALYGIGTIADEKSSGTIGFLLTKSISRTRIYTTKLLLNLGGLAVVFLLSSLIIYVIYLISKSIPLVEYQDVGGIPIALPPVQIEVHTVGFEEMLVKTVSTLFLGLCFVCISGLISIFARSLLESLSLNLGVVVIYVISLNWLHSFPFYLETENPNDLFIIGGLVLLTLVFFVAGLLTFKHKEF